MERHEKLRILADAAKYDASCASSGGKRETPAQGMGNVSGMGICHSYAPDGRCISLLKILLTNYCVYDCRYCINRVSSNVERAKFSVEDVVSLTLDFYRRNYIEGLFLSSGVFRSSDDTMQEMIEIARCLREDHKFGGYIHLKAVAGSSADLVARAGRWADRLSANIELPTDADLHLLAPAKTHREVHATMNRIATDIDAHAEVSRGGRRQAAFAPAGQSTQMIVGATPSTDRQILATSDIIYSRYRLRRVYYSAFSPIPHADAHLPDAPPPLQRENRLYQADWLVRFYGFQVGELTTDDIPNLDLKLDPKMTWALRNRQLFPIDINKASKAELLRVPGLGVRTVERILIARRHTRLRLADLGKMHVPMRRTRFFVTAADQNVALRVLERSNLTTLVTEPQQLSLFSAKRSARDGEL